MKKLLEPIRITLVVLLILAEVIFFSWLKSIHIDYIKMKDYPAIYKEQLDIIFGGDYEIGPRQTISEIVSDEAGKKFYQFYYTWDITYRDSYGDEYIMELTNEYSFDSQIYRQMGAQAGKYFEEMIRTSNFSDYIDYGYLRRIFSSYSPTSEIEEAIKIVRAAMPKIEPSFESLDNLPHLYDVCYRDWFVTHPEVFRVFMYESSACDEIIQHIVDSLSRETDGKFNLIISIRPNQISDEKKKTEKVYYILGEQQEFEKDDDYDLALFYRDEEIGMFD